VRQRLLPVPPLPSGRPNLVVTGFMGTGKTEAGRRVAAILGLPFFDLDAVVETRAGMRVSGIFDRLGQERFRAMERQALTDASLLSAAVIATGGAAPLHDRAWRAMAEASVVVVLDCTPEEIERRLAADGARPLLQPDPPRRIRKLLDERRDAYAAAGEGLHTDGLDPDAVAELLAERYRAAMPLPSAPFEVVVAGEAATRVLIGEDVLDRIGGSIAEGVQVGSPVVIVVDRLVPHHVEGRVRAGLAGAGFRPTTVAIHGGEEAKSVEGLSRLWERFRDAGLDRTGAVVAVGGGTVLDIAGLAAATYARGVPTVNVPTTLLAMADAGLGGKVGLNHAGVKNLAGAFHHPRVVAVDVALLPADPRGGAGMGWAEIAKAALLASPLALDGLRAGSAMGSNGNLWFLEQAIRVKAAYVGEDPFDHGVRASLNLGHTFAHAIEAASGYQRSHGEAVALGLVAAARLGTALGLTPEGLDRKLADLLAGIGLPVVCPDLAEETLLEAMRSDKKRTAEGAAFVVPAAPGAYLVEGVDPGMALAAMYPDRGRVLHG
jgi:shikimate kinase/3-dehydroquinate synthase